METQLYIQTTSTTNENIKSKKLIQPSGNIELNNTLITNITTETHDTITEYEINMTEQSNNISSREALKDKVHEIHNFLRNNGAGYGMMALKLFLLFFGLKKIEEKGLFEKTGLTPECRFSHLLEHARTGNGELVLETICKTVLDAIYDSILKPFLFYEIPKDLSAKVFIYLLEQIEEITVIERTCDVLLSGNIYEYFIGRDESAISELGAYFTVRWITRYCMGKSNLQLNNDGSIPTMIDMFGGSGGFTTEYIRHFVQNYPEIDWETQLSNVSHYDMNEDVVKSAALEFFCLTGVIPKMGADGQLCRKNSFCDEFDNQKYQRLLTNPPYGGDKNKKTEAQDKTQKIKEYITRELPTITDTATRISRQKQLEDIIKQEKEHKKKAEDAKVSVATSSARIQRYAKKYDLKGTDKEAVSLIQFMDMVADGGRVVGVLKEGVFFDKSYRKLREHLVTHFNVREIISVPQDQFENTSTKTSILVFDNVAEKTTKVVFRELVVDKYVEDKFAEVRGKIVLAESAGDICGVADSIVSEATVEELLANKKCSFDGKDYSKKELVVGDEYDAIQLGDICEFLPKSKRQASFGESNGNYNFYSSSDKLKRCDLADYTESCVLIGTGGNSCIHYTSPEFSCSTDVLLLKSRQLNEYYMYYMLIALKHILIDGMRGTTIKHVTKEMVLNFKVPVPKSPEKTQQWVDYISAPYNEKNAKRGRVAELETFVQNRIREIATTEECEEVELGSICEINPETLKNNQFTKINYIDISSVKAEEINTIQTFTESFPSRAKRIIRKNDMLFSTVRPNLKGYAYINEHIENGVASTGFVVIRCTKIYPRYIYTILKDDKVTEYLMTNSTGTQYPAVNSSVFETIKIKLPKNRQLIADLEPVFEEIERLQQEIKVADELYQSRIQELAKEAMPEQLLIANESPVLENTFIETDEPETPDDAVSVRTPKQGGTTCVVVRGITGEDLSSKVIVAESVATTSTTTSCKKPRKPRAKKEPKEKVAKEPKPKKETKPRKPRTKKESPADK
jgi:type I restriction enzyme S subunit